MELHSLYTFFASFHGRRHLAPLHALRCESSVLSGPLPDCLPARAGAGAWALMYGDRLCISFYVQ